MNSILLSLIGGVLIGISVSAMLFFNGRVTGISGILSSSLTRPNKEGFWRWMFLAGMFLGGILIYFIHPEFFVNETDRSWRMALLAGLLVGYGTVMGSGCTSGHGVCGISRLSVRSVLATVTFMLFGFFAVQLVRYLMQG